MEQKLMDMITMVARQGAGRAVLAHALLGCGPVSAAAEDPILYVCVEGVGRKELTNSYKAGCKRLDLPAPLPAPLPAARGKASSAGAALPLAPGEFPRVDSARQKALDSDRRMILANELRMEEARLVQLQAELKSGQPKRPSEERDLAKYQERAKQMADNVSRTEQNVGALRREIASVK